VDWRDEGSGGLRPPAGSAARSAAAGSGRLPGGSALRDAVGGGTLAAGRVLPRGSW